MYMTTLKKKRECEYAPFGTLHGLGRTFSQICLLLCISFDKTKSFVERIVYGNFHITINISLSQNLWFGDKELFIRRRGKNKPHVSYVAISCQRPLRRRGKNMPHVSYGAISCQRPLRRRGKNNNNYNL